MTDFACYSLRCWFLLMCLLVCFMCTFVFVCGSWRYCVHIDRVLVCVVCVCAYFCYSWRCCSLLVCLLVGFVCVFVVV